MQKRILECVPNFSEGRDKSVIQKIANSINGVAGAKILHIDIGYAANRTVITFAGEPEAVIEAAFLATKAASENIDMTKHTGVHPRLGATDVLPLIPISGITMDETIGLSYKLAARIGSELEIPVFCYENSALKPDAPYGSTPNAVTFNKDESVLLIANADNNYLALFDISSPGESKNIVNTL